MKKLILGLFVMSALCIPASAATLVKPIVPGEPPVGHAGDLGGGVIVGSPVGLSGKYWLNTLSAIDAVLGWHFGANDRFQAHADYLWHIAVPQLHIPDGHTYVHTGLGIRVLSGPSAEAGIRLPLGLTHLLFGSRTEAFAEIAPTVRFAPDAGASIDGGIGIRYYFR